MVGPALQLTNDQSDIQKNIWQRNGNIFGRMTNGGQRFAIDQRSEPCASPLEIQNPMGKKLNIYEPVTDVGQRFAVDQHSEPHASESAMQTQLARNGNTYRTNDHW